MSKDRFDLEQSIMDCWNVTDDIGMVTDYFVDNPKFEHMPADITDAIMNKYLGIKELYEIRFQRLWDCFEDMIENKQFADTSVVTLSGSGDSITLGELSDYTMKDDMTPTISFSVKDGD